MPLYDYVCLDCQERFETLVLSREEEVTCPRCDSRRVERSVSIPAKSHAGMGRPLGGTLSGCGTKRGFS